MIEEPRLAAGVLVFDVLIANGDRNATNLSRDAGFTPPRLSVFDHGHALFGTDEPRGPERLRLAMDRLGCADDAAGIARNSALLHQPLDSAFMEEWAERARRIPAFVFEDICQDVANTPGLNVTGEMARELAAWLASRAAGVGRLIWDNQESFPAVNWTLWGPEEQPS